MSAASIRFSAGSGFIAVSNHGFELFVSVAAK